MKYYFYFIYDIHTIYINSFYSEYEKRLIQKGDLVRSQKKSAWNSKKGTLLLLFAIIKMIFPFYSYSRVKTWDEIYLKIPPKPKSNFKTFVQFFEEM